jgi:hypothetical protein
MRRVDRSRYQLRKVDGSVTGFDTWPVTFGCAIRMVVLRSDTGPVAARQRRRACISHGSAPVAAIPPPDIELRSGCDDGAQARLGPG